MRRCIGLKVQAGIGLRQIAGSPLRPFDQPEAASLVVIAKTQHLKFVGMPQPVEVEVQGQPAAGFIRLEQGIAGTADVTGDAQ